MPRFAAAQLRDALDHQRQHTALHVRFDASRGPMLHRRHLDLRTFEGSEAALDDHQSLVAASGIFQTDGVVIGLQHPLAVVFGRLPDGCSVNANLSGLCDAQVAFEAT